MRGTWGEVVNERLNLVCFVLEGTGNRSGSMAAWTGGSPFFFALTGKILLSQPNILSARPVQQTSGQHILWDLGYFFFYTCRTAEHRLPSSWFGAESVVGVRGFPL